MNKSPKELEQYNIRELQKQEMLKLTKLLFFHRSETNLEIGEDILTGIEELFDRVYHPQKEVNT